MSIVDDQKYNYYENMNFNNTLQYRDHDQLITITRKSLKKVTKLLLSVSLFSLLLSYSSSLYPIFIHSFKSNSFFPHNLQVLLTHILDKNFTFLVCNGILVFLAKTSGLLRSRSGLDHQRRIQKINVVGIQMDHPATGTSLEELENYDNQDSTNVKEYSPASPNCPLKEAPSGGAWDSTNHDEYLFPEGSKNEEQEKSEAKEGEVQDIGLLSAGVGRGAQQDHTNYSFTNDENIEKDSESSFLSFAKEDAEDKSRLESSALVSTEELNKRFDEFIRKMRERLRTEAAGQKLIMV
ncbi:hypothetical protein AgCh_031456 [Apium graveolens]